MSALLDQPFASSAMGDSMDADLLPELSGETWVAATYLKEVTADLEPAGSEPDFITASRLDNTLITFVNGFRLVRHHLSRTVLDCHRSCNPGSCNLEIYQLIRKIVSGAAEHHWRRHHSWWFLSVCAGVLFSDTMIPYSLDIWVFPQQFTVCWTESIGLAFVWMFGRI